jgi:hypothetical protein
MNSLIGHPEPSLFEGVRTSSDTTGVILSGAFPREDLIFLGFLFFINTFKDEILTSHNTLLRMTEWVDEIATSPGKRHRNPQNDGMD